MRKFKPTKKILMIVAALVVASLLGFFAYNRAQTSSANNEGVPKNTQVKSQKITLDKSFDLPTGLEKDNGKPLKITFQTAQLTNRILTNGKARYAKPGTVYLMLNLLMENGNTKRISLRSRDVIRLIDNNDKKFAPSLYNKDVAIEADSVKKDVVGFLVPDNIKTFRIQYGALSGEKQTLELKFN